MIDNLHELLGSEADDLLQYQAKGFSRDRLHLPGSNGGFKALKFGKWKQNMYDELTPGDHPIELTRYEVANGYMGRIPLISSGGASGKNDFAEAARTAIINKRAGGIGLISGRKAFQRPMEEGIRLLHLIQDIYLDPSITVA